MMRAILSDVINLPLDYQSRHLLLGEQSNVKLVVVKVLQYLQ